jgi:hypothetical protein
MHKGFSEFKQRNTSPLKEKKMKSRNKLAWGVVAGLWAVMGTVDGARADLLPAPELVDVQATQIFAPPGFDSNDVAQIVVHGDYRDTCYRSAPPEVTIDREHRMITVAPKAYLRSGCWCAPVLVSFTQPVELGMLAAGKYRVVEFDGRGKVLHETSLSIAADDSVGPDNFLYAPVKNVQVIQVGADRELLMSGTFSSECMELQEIKALHRTANVIEVLPITSYKSGSNCDNTRQRPFEARVKLPASEPGETLLHVRLLNGQAINVVEPF